MLRPFALLCVLAVGTLLCVTSADESPRIEPTVASEPTAEPVAATTFAEPTAAEPTVEVAAVADEAGDEPADDARTATGVVFHDGNGNEKRDDGEKGLGGIRVSNGREVVVTDDRGRYTLPVDDDTILFVVKPRGFRTPLSATNNPRFYYVHKPNGSPESFRFAGVAPTGPLPASVDFPLVPQNEPETFKAIMFGDPQPRNQKEVDWIGHDVVEELVGTDAAFGVTLGDIVFDDLAMFEPQARAIALIGVPWYNVIGNHDINFDAPNDRLSDETFERHFGPSYYSFDYGPVHFVVLDDVEWIVETSGQRGRYRGGFGEEQVKWVENDLAHVPDEQLVVLMMHIPLTGVTDRHPLYRVIEKRSNCISISGHTHTHDHVFVDGGDGWQGPKPHHHMVNVTVSGSWWSGAPDERGIPHTTMRDGGPNGYSILNFDGNDYSLDYRAAGRSADYQMEITAPDQVAVGDGPTTDLWVNVFNGSANDPVEYRIAGGPWTKLAHRRTVDPRYKATYDAEAEIDPLPWRKLSAPRPSSHVWHGKLPANLPVGTHAVEVRTTDLFGRTFEDRRVIRVVE